MYLLLSPSNIHYNWKQILGAPNSVAITLSIIGRLLTVLLGRRKERAWGRRVPVLIVHLLASLQCQTESSSASLDGMALPLPLP